MDSVDMDIPASDLMRDCTLNVRIKGMQVWRVRIWLGCKLIKMAALVMGCGFRIDDPNC